MNANRGLAIPLALTVTLLLASCSLLFPPAPTPTISDVVGVWTSQNGDAVLSIRDDMTFDLHNVPTDYLDGTFLGDKVDTLHLSTFSGTWELRQASYFGDYPSVILSWGSSQEYVFLNMNFTGDELRELYLTAGDPDMQLFLRFLNARPVN